MKTNNAQQVTSKTQIIFKLVIASLLFCPGLVINFHYYVSGFSVAAAQQGEHKKTRKTPAMREKIYSQLSMAQKLADEKKVAEGLEILNRLKRRGDLLNSYERAMVWNFLAFIHYANDDLPATIAAFSKVVEQENIPEALELSTLFSLAQLNMQQEDYSQCLHYLQRWEALYQGELDGKALVLKANAHYAMKNYQLALTAIDGAIANNNQAQKLPLENWLVLKRALHFELKQNQAVTRVSEDLVRYYAKPQYWIELANMYGENGDSRKQLAVMEAAYQQGFINKKADIQTLAQLYFFAGTPVKSANLLSEQLANGVLNQDIKTLKFLAQSWTAAKEDRKAVPILQQAAELSSDGNMDARLAEVLLNLERWQDAIDAAKIAQQKGKLDNLGNLYVSLGIAYFNLQRFDHSIAQFNLAKQQKNVAKMAGQWLQYVEMEQQKVAAQQLSLASLGQ